MNFLLTSGEATVLTLKPRMRLLPDCSPPEPPYPAGARGAVVVEKRGSVVVNITAKEAASKREIEHFPLTWREAMQSVSKTEAKVVPLCHQQLQHRINILTGPGQSDAQK